MNKKLLSVILAAGCVAGSAAFQSVDGVARAATQEQSTAATHGDVALTITIDDGAPAPKKMIMNLYYPGYTAMFVGDPGIRLAATSVSRNETVYEGTAVVPITSPVASGTASIHLRVAVASNGRAVLSTDVIASIGGTTSALSGATTITTGGEHCTCGIEWVIIG
jgi:hypothetical protein